MPKPAATQKQIEAVRKKMIRETIFLINEIGFSGFSMRKLGSRLGVAAKTIYNYFSDKDELYLEVLSKGFSLLHNGMTEAAKVHTDPLGQLLAMAHAYVCFGLENPHYYNVLFSMDLPRFSDYIDTKHERLADSQNRSALKIAETTRMVIEKIICQKFRSDPREVDYLLMQLWTSLHGIVSLNNSRVTLEVGNFEKDIDRMVDDAVRIVQ